MRMTNLPEADKLKSSVMTMAHLPVAARAKPSATQMPKKSIANRLNMPLFSLNDLRQFRKLRRRNRQPLSTMSEIHSMSFKTLFTIFLVYIVLGYLFVKKRPEIFQPIEENIQKLSRKAAYALCYEISKSVRFAVVYPFRWYFINSHSSITFLLPPDTAGYHCGPGSLPGAKFTTYKSTSLNIDCVLISYETLDNLSKTLPYEKFAINLNEPNNKDQIPPEEVTAILVINQLLKEGIFTLEK